MNKIKKGKAPHNLYEVFKNYEVVMLNKIHTLIPAVVLSFDPVKMEASVLPLGRPVIAGKEVEPQPIDRCPVCFLNDSTFAIRHPLKKDDLVVVGFSEVSLEKILTTKKPESITRGNRFNISDGIVLGTIDGEYDKMIAEHSEDLLIINKKTGHKIIFKADGSIDTTVEVITALNATSIKAPKAIIVCRTLIANEKVEAPLVNGTTDVTFAGISGKGHTHKYIPGSGSSTDTSSPK